LLPKRPDGASEVLVSAFWVPNNPPLPKADGAVAFVVSSFGCDELKREPVEGFVSVLSCFWANYGLGISSGLDSGDFLPKRPSEELGFDNPPVKLKAGFCCDGFSPVFFCPNNGVLGVLLLRRD
jgi:hypothetical protein